MATNSRSNYPAILASAWAGHLAARAESAPTVISLFAGCGGSSLGYSMAGFRELLAVEWDDNAVETFRMNFPGVPVFHGDVAALSVDECLRLAGATAGEIDVLDGSPPCQGFSTAGKRELGDGRNQLFRQYARLLEGLRPKCLVMENVSGMVKGKMRLVFVEILRALKAAGYRVRARLMNAAYFGVPQSRQRIIFVGVRDDLGVEPGFPPAAVAPITVRQAIGHLPPGRPGRHEPQVVDAWRKSTPGQSLRKAVKYVGSFQSVRLDPEAPSNTQIRSHLHWHYAVPRLLTIGEASALMSYPPGFRWAGRRTDAKERIGNSVPPLFMRAIAMNLRRTVLDQVAAEVTQ